jgi:hypothetical protein
MGKMARGSLAATIVLAVGWMSILPASASSTRVATSRSTGMTTASAAARPCHKARRSSCRRNEGTQSVTGTDGGLTVTFTATETGATATFDIASSETQAYGALGPEYLSYGDGNSQGFGMPQYCLAHPVAESSDRQISYTYGGAGTYSASVTVGANCTPDQLTLTLTINIG